MTCSALDKEVSVLARANLEVADIAEIVSRETKRPVFAIAITTNGGFFDKGFRDPLTQLGAVHREEFQRQVEARKRKIDRKPSKVKNYDTEREARLEVAKAWMKPQGRGSRKLKWFVHTVSYHVSSQGGIEEAREFFEYHKRIINSVKPIVMFIDHSSTQ